MASSLVENMTIGEISDRVSAMNNASDLQEDAHRRSVVKEATARIVDIVTVAHCGVDPHPFRKGRFECASCRYAEDHPVHRIASS